MIDRQDAGRLLDQVVGELVPAAGEGPTRGDEQIGSDVQGLTHDVVSALAGGGCA